MPRGSASMHGTWAALLVLLFAPTAFAGWKLLFRQQVPDSGTLPLFHTMDEVLSSNPDDLENGKYSILETLGSEDHKGGDGKFLFKYSDGDRVSHQHTVVPIAFHHAARAMCTCSSQSECAASCASSSTSDHSLFVLRRPRYGSSHTTLLLPCKIQLKTIP